eukprot:scaffold660612_cov37-Prasinocladus_malaysianus.AAC.1
MEPLRDDLGVATVARLAAHEELEHRPSLVDHPRAWLPHGPTGHVGVCLMTLLMLWLTLVFIRANRCRRTRPLCIPRDCLCMCSPSANRVDSR